MARGRAKPSQRRKASRTAKITSDTRRVAHRVIALDPLKKCGSGTTVVALFRVGIRSPEEGDSTHLVYLDRRGWYCDHGRECPAVAMARRFAVQ